MKRQIRMQIEKWTGYNIVRQIPFGIDEFADVKAKFPNHSFQIILDVGANEGQSARHIRDNFEAASIISIEPIKATFEALVRNTKALNVKCFNFALGAQNEEVDVITNVENQNSVMNSLVDSNNIHTNTATKSETVKVFTLDQFCKDHKISRIDFLKIDTEGFDLEVLRGAEGWLENQSIPFVMTEVSMNPTNTFHVDFVEVKSYMEHRGYYIFGIYEQVQEWKTKTPILRRSNILFISKQMAYGK